MIPLPYGRHAVDADDIAAVKAVLESDWLTTGPAVDAFEATLKETLKAPHAVAVANGTAALHAAYTALGLGPGDTIIVPAITFVASANAARMAGADVVFADVDPETGLMTVDTLNDAIQSAGAALKAVCVVHLGGQPVDLAAISAICKQRNLLLIEDACHAIGSTYQESTIGDCTYSDVATFSFHPVKTIAMGEGGAVLTPRGDIAEKVRTLRHHSLVASDDVPRQRLMHDLGYNYRACDIQCALGKSQLQKLDRFKQIRSALVEQYRLTLAALDGPASLNPLKVTTEPCHHLAQARIDFAALGTTREEVVAALASVGIGTQVHYYPVNAQPYYTDLYGAADTPGAWSYYDKTLSLPLHVNMTLAEVNFICRQLHGILTGQDMRQCA